MTLSSFLEVFYFVASVVVAMLGVWIVLNILSGIVIALRTFGKPPPPKPDKGVKPKGLRQTDPDDNFLKLP